MNPLGVLTWGMRTFRKMRTIEVALLTLSVCFISDVLIRRPTPKISATADGNLPERLSDMANIKLLANAPPESPGSFKPDQSLQRIDNAHMENVESNMAAESKMAADSNMTADKESGEDSPSKEGAMDSVNYEQLAEVELGDGKPRHVLILGYQRCGSSLMGLLFNANPDAFFLFEPADGVYTALYGTANGWNVPTDIFNHANGSFRIIPRVEIEALTATLEHLLTCDISRVPTEVLTHSFMAMWLKRQRRISPFVRCATSRKVKASECQKIIRGVCPKRFGENVEKHERCRMLLWDVRAHPVDYEMTRLGEVMQRYRRYYSRKTMLSKPIDETVSIFRNYHSCMYNATQRLKPCYNALEDVCKSSNVRSIKTVRVTMETAHALLDKLPDLRVVHVMRDPRPVAVSRLKQSSFRGRTSGKDILKEAGFYCERALHDIKVQQHLSEQYSDSFYQIIYEALSEDSLAKMESLYQFIKSDVPDTLRQWVIQNTQNRRNSSAISHSWMGNMTYEMAHNIDTVCQDLRNAVNYKWP